MNKKQITFFATKEDILTVMLKVEAEFEIEYIEMGMFDSSVLVKYSSLNDVPMIGFTDFGNWISLDNRFMIVERKKLINIREVVQRKGGTKYAVDPMLNPISIELSTGGIYKQKEKVLIAGRVANINDNDFSLHIYKAVATEMKKKFRKINTSFIGKEAEEKLKEGWRLVTNEKSPMEYDLSA